MVLEGSVGLVMWLSDRVDFKTVQLNSSPYTFACKIGLFCSIMTYSTAYTAKNEQLVAS